MDKLKMSYLCFLVVLVGVSLPMAFGKQNLLTDGDFSSGTLDAWTDYDGDTNGTNTESVDYDEAEPGKEPCLKITNDARDGVQTNNHRFYQSFPVTPGKYYQFTGRWKGDLKTTETDKHYWAEIFVGFTDNAVVGTLGAADNTSILFKKRYEWNDASYGYPDTGTFMDDGQWDWEDMVAGQGDTWNYDPLVGLVAPEWATHAIFAMNLGGNGTTVGAETTTIWVDDLGVMACQVPAGEATGFDISDLNMDCRTDIVDLAIISAAWLSCNLDPVDDGSLGTCF